MLRNMLNRTQQARAWPARPPTQRCYEEHVTAYDKGIAQMDDI